MPTQKKKDLHLATNMKALKAQAELPKKVNTANCRVLLKSATGMMEHAQRHLLEGDEERAYVFFMKFMDLVQRAQKSTEAKKDPSFVKKMISPASLMKAMDELERLDESLRNRYEYKEAEAVSKKLEMLDSKPPAEDPRPSKSKQNTDDKPDVTADTSDEKAPNKSGTRGEISVLELYSLLQSNESVLLLDTRPEVDYAQSHHRHTDTINVPQQSLTPGTTAFSLVERLPTDAQTLFSRRAQFDYIVLLDFKSQPKDVTGTHTLQILKDAIYKWDSTTILRSEPLVLCGGYEDWFLHYPALCTGKVQLQTTNIHQAPSLDFEYPDMDDIFHTPLITPAPKPGETNAPKVDRLLKPNATTTQPTAQIAPNVTDNQSAASSEVSNYMTDQSASLQSNQPTNQSQSSSLPNNQSTKSSQPPAVIRTNKPTDGNKLQEQKNEYLNDLLEKLKRLKASSQQLKEIEGLKTKEIQELADLQRLRRRLEAECKDLEQRNRDARSASAEATNTKPADVAADVTAPVRPSDGNTRPTNAAASTTSRLNPPAVQPTVQPSVNGPAATVTSSVSATKPADTSNTQLPTASQPNIPQNSSGQPQPRGSQPGQPQVHRSNQPAQPQAHKDKQPSSLPTVSRGGQPKPTREKSPTKPMPSKPELSSKSTDQNVSPTQMQTTKGLPAGWQKKLDKDTNRYYYVDHTTKSTHWHLPAGVVQELPAAPKPAPSHTPTTTAGVHKTKLKGDGPGQSGQMKRSNSTPDLTALDDDLKPGGTQTASTKPSDKQTPVVSRGTKPNAPLQPVNKSYQKPKPIKLTAEELRSFQPVYGSVRRGTTGLRNLGNTCFMNSVIQCLSNTTLLAEFFISGVFERDVNVHNKLGHSGDIARHFAVLIKVLWMGQYKYVAPYNFKNIVSRHYDMFCGSEQHDAQELMSFLMDGLHEDLNRVLKRPQLSEQNNDGIPDVDAANLAWKQHKLLNASLIVELFQGQFKSSVRCLKCGKESVTFDAFMYLSVPIPNKRHCSIVDCLNEFLKPEELRGESRWNCPQCKAPRDAIKQINIWKLPRVLLLHLKRFWYEGSFRRKITDHVNYPLDGLDFSQAVLDPHARKSTFKLYGVVNHFGGMEGGHYIANCLNAETGRWYKYDDDAVSTMSSSSVCSSAGYILFYTNL